MSSKKLFKSAAPGKTPNKTNTVNAAGGAAYSLSDKEALAQYACTGTLGDQFYTTGSDQLDKVLELAGKVEPEFVAKVAVYSRDKASMKDMPALLSAVLANKGPEGIDLLKRIAPKVLDSSKMVRNFVQIIRSGKTGRKSLGSAPKKIVEGWFGSKTPEQIFKQSVGNDPSLADLIKMVHPVDMGDSERRALYGYLIGKKVEDQALPPLVRQYEEFKKDSDKALPQVPFEMLAGLTLSPKAWKDLALQLTWTQLRMNLNTLGRHGVYDSMDVVHKLAKKLQDPALIEKAKPFPYQLMMAYLNTSEADVPFLLRDALHEALELSTKNVPVIEGQIYVGVDVSGSMGCSVTGNRGTATSKARCIDVAALVGATLLRKNPATKVMAFDTRLHQGNLEPRDSILSNAKKLATYGGRGTDCSVPLKELNLIKAKGDLFVMVSDNESWFDTGTPRYRNTTGTASEWASFKARNPKAKMVCIDIQTSPTTQVGSDKSVLNIGGFSDTVWETVVNFVNRPENSSWVAEIEKTQL